MSHSRKLRVFKETPDRIMTLRCLGIGWPLAKTFTYRGAKLYSSIAKDIRDTGNLNMYVIKPGFIKKMKNRHARLEHRVSHRIQMKFNRLCDFALNLQSL